MKVAAAMLGAGLFIHSSGCQDSELTQITVVVGSDIDHLDGVRIGWDGLGAVGQRDVSFDDGRPATLALVHRSGPLGLLEVTAEGMRAGSVVGPEREGIVSFVEGELRLLRLDLYASCVGRACGEAETCVEGGRCELADAARLEPWAETPVGLDASHAVDGGERDAGTDALTGDGGCSGAEETCNAVDDDCDGKVDEDFLVSTVAHCGRCSVACQAECDLRACAEAHVALTAGASHTCALNDAGSVFCWGANAERQLGSATHINSSVPVPVERLPDTPAIELAAGNAFSCALLEGGEVWCWGSDADGQHGDAMVDSDGAPSRAELSMAATAVTAGAGHACAIAAGDVYCWGRNDVLQIGVPSAGGRHLTEPAKVDVAGLEGDALEVSAGATHTCALFVGGVVYCWGANDTRQLGTAATAQPSGPTRVIPTASTTYGVQAGGGFSCLLQNNRGKCWGAAAQGRLGDGTGGQPRHQPADVIGNGAPVTDMVSMALGAEHACAVLHGGRVVCWGSNDYGELGQGSTNDRSLSALRVMGIDDAVRVTAGSGHSCARMVDGDVWCWGTTTSVNSVTARRRAALSPRGSSYLSNDRRRSAPASYAGGGQKSRSHTKSAASVQLRSYQSASERKCMQSPLPLGSSVS